MTERRALAGNAGIADQDVEPVMPFIECLGEAVDARIISYIERHQRRRRAGGAHRIVKFFERTLGAPGGDDVRAGPGQRDGQRAADAARGAGDERDVIGEWAGDVGHGGDACYELRASRASLTPGAL